MTKFLNKIGNSFVKAILRSPLHGLLSKSVAIITFTGRTSGKIYSTPVNYQVKDETIWILSQRDRTWWRNLRQGAKVTLRLGGSDVHGWAEVLEDPEEVASGLMNYLTWSPSFARYFNVGLDSSGDPILEDVRHAASSRVMIRIRQP